MKKQSVMHSAKGGRKPVASVLTPSYTIDEAANQAADSHLHIHAHSAQ